MENSKTRGLPPVVPAPVQQQVVMQQYVFQQQQPVQGGVLQQPVQGGVPHQPVQYMSPEQMAAYSQQQQPQQSYMYQPAPQHSYDQPQFDTPPPLATAQVILDDDSSTNKYAEISPPGPPPAPLAPSVPQREGKYIVNDSSLLGSTISVKTPEGQEATITLPEDCPIGAVITYVY